MTSSNDTLIGDFEGIQPAADKVSKKILNQLYGDIAKYTEFIEPRLVSDCVEKARQVAKEAGVKDNSPTDRPFFMSDGDMGINGSTGNSFVFVKPGKPEKPLRIIVAHSDVPSLMIPVNPVYTEHDSERSLACPSISLLTEPFGGVRPDDWYGQEVDIVGKVFIKGKERRIEIPGRIRQKSVHVEDPRFAKTLEGLKVDLGFRWVNQLYNAFGFTSCDDFARAKLYCLPHIVSGKNGRLIGNELGAFGHDDRSCVWASLKAGLESLVKNDNTLMIFGLDNEEVGSPGNSANYRGFFEAALRETLNVVYKDKSREIELPLDLNRKLLGNMPAILADVTVGLGPEELDNPSDVNLRGASKLGWGVTISAGGTVTSPKHVDSFMSLLDKNLPGKKREQRYQVGGSYLPVDSFYSAGSMSDPFQDTVPFLNVGIPVTGLHHPRVETINVFDLFWLKEAYKLYLQH